MRARAGFAVVAVALLAVACSDGDSATVTDPSTTTLVTTPPEGVTTVPGATTVAGPPDGTTATTRPIAPPAAATVILRPDGLGVVAFGASKVDTISALSAALGPLDETGTGCEAAGPSASTARWDELRVQFIGPSFDSYNVRPPNGIAPVLDLKTEDGIGLGAPVADLEAAYGPRLAIPGLPPEFGGENFAVSFPDTDRRILGSLSDTTVAGTVTQIFTQVCE